MKAASALTRIAIGIVIATSLAAACRSKSATQPEELETLGIGATRTLASQTEPTVEDRMLALRDSLYYGANKDYSRLNSWFESPNSASDKLLPLVMLDSPGSVVPFASGGTLPFLEVHYRDAVPSLIGYRAVGSITQRLVSFGAFRANSLPDSAIPSVGSGPTSELTPITEENFWPGLPDEIHLLNGIAWAMTRIPETTGGQHSLLKNDLGLAIPEQTISSLTQTFGAMQLLASQDGNFQIRLQFDGKPLYVVAMRKGYVTTTNGGQTARQLVPANSLQSEGLVRDTAIIRGEDPVSDMAGEFRLRDSAYWRLVTSDYHEF